MKNKLAITIFLFAIICVSSIKAQQVVINEINYNSDEVSFDTDDWIEELAVSHIPVRRESKYAKYLAWVKFVAVRDMDDLGIIAREFGITLGISESRIADAIQENFPDN